MWRGLGQLILGPEKGVGTELVFRREDEDDRRVLALQRTYRDEIHVLLDPTQEEMDTAQSGNLWKVWNTERPEYLASIV